MLIDNGIAVDIAIEKLKIYIADKSSSCTEYHADGKNISLKRDPTLQ